MLEILALALLGCAIGIITGLTPGLHLNTVCLIGLSLYPLVGLNTTDFGVIMTAAATTQSFIDFIPAIFIGVPEEETALSVLPAHRLVMKGRAMEAVTLTAYGSLLGIVYGLLFLIPVMYIVPVVHKALKDVIIYVVITAVVVLIAREKNKKAAVTSFVLSGCLGLLSLDMKILSPTQSLLPLFTGLFGLSNILLSLKEKTAKVHQEADIKVSLDRKMAFSGMLGSLCGIVVGLLPAMSPSQIGILAYDLLGSDLRGFLVSVSAINTSDALYSMVSLQTINNPRSGVAAMLGQIMTVDINTLLLFVGVMALATLIATLAHMQLGGAAMKLLARIDYGKLNLCVALFMTALIYWMTGFAGIFLAVIATAIGVIPIVEGVSRTHLMGVLILPTATFFLAP
jgi:putative membrane protein